jgi:GNAT superfamily N-acetyltransferase
MTSHKAKRPIYRYRLATSHDASAVFSLLEEGAPEIPFPEFPIKKQLLVGRIKKACIACDVWIALDRDDQIVGFLIAEPFGNGFDLSYGGVTKAHRGNGIFPDLLEKMKDRRLPLGASVALSNKKMPAYLRKFGFAPDFPMPTNNEDMFLWEPEPSEHPAGGG